MRLLGGMSDGPPMEARQDVKITAQHWFVAALLLSILIAVTACSPPERYRLWQTGAAEDSQWEERDLYSTKAQCEAARRGLVPILVAGSRTACVREGRRPEDIGL